MKFYVIDGHASIYRAYYAIKSRLSAPGTGQPTHAVFGFTKIIRALLDAHKPDYLVVALDSPGKTFRHERYTEYKANRKAMPEDLVSQLPYVDRVCEAYGIPIFRVPGFEADDLMGTLARLGRENGLEVILVSGDKDALQLVEDGVRVLDPVKDVLYDAEKVKEKRGVPPERIVDFLGLAGDSSDNIPGVPGVGPKKALKLLSEHDSLDAVLAASPNVKGKMGENLREFADQARLSRELATIDRRAPIELDVEECRAGRADQEKLIALFQELGFRDFMDSLAQSHVASEVDYEALTSARELEAFVRELSRKKLFSFDIETDSRKPVGAHIVGMSFSWKDGWARYVPIRAPEKQECVDERKALSLLRPILEDPKKGKVGQNIKYDCIVLKGVGVELRGIEFDTMVASYLTSAGSRQHSLDALALEHLSYKTITLKEVIGRGKSQTTMDKVSLEHVTPYACEDADITWRLREILLKKLKGLDLEKLCRELELPLIPVLAQMEENGVLVDVGALREMSADMERVLRDYESDIHKEAGKDFNVNSPKQLAQILFEERGLKPPKKTKTGLSTDAWVLERLARKDRLAALVLEYRKYQKLKSTYVDALPEDVNERTGRIHASFNQTVTATGRLSSSDPNLQNIPVRSEMGKGIRACFIAPNENTVLLAVDYSQVELRMLAHVSGDALLVQSFRNGRDVHRAVAAEVVGASEDDVTPEMRRRAKAVNFGLIYGQSAGGLAQSTGMSFEEAQEFIERYFSRYAGVKRCLDGIVEKARAEHGVKTVLGRVRYLPGIDSGDFRTRRMAERMAVNTVFQGSAADLMKKAMIEIHRELSRFDGARMILQIHDELVFEVPARGVNGLREMVVEKMEGAMKLRVPLEVDCGVGSTWLEAGGG